MIHATDITKSFGQLQVLKGIDLNIEKGEFVSITGASGAGKTTLLQIIGTLDRPDSGKLTVDGCDVLHIGNNALSDFRNKHIGFVFQFHQLLPEFSALENVEIPAMIARRDRKEYREEAKRILGLLGLQGRLDHKSAELSGGEKQRVAVARALMNKPSLILADEPSGSLDSKNKTGLHNLLLDLNRQMGYTVLVVTHDSSLAEMADRTIEMKDGLIVNG